MASSPLTIRRKVAKNLKMFDIKLIYMYMYARYFKTSVALVFNSVQLLFQNVLALEGDAALRKLVEHVRDLNTKRFSSF